MTADEIISSLDLHPHPEGGWYRETWRADASSDTRPSGTAIYFLLQSGERSHWHRVDATEIWHFYCGAPLDLFVSPDENGPAMRARLGPNLTLGEQPQVIIPSHHWQSAETTGEWTLVGCTVSPGFDFDGFELANPGFDIPKQI